MKVKFKYGIATYSGKLDEMVYGSYNDGKLCIGRDFVYPTLNANHELLGSVGANLSALWAEASAGYKADLKTYAHRNKMDNVPKTRLAPSAYALFIKLMYAWQADDPEHVELSSVTGTDVDSLGSKIASIKACVENGMLPAVSTFADLTEAF